MQSAREGESDRSRLQLTSAKTLARSPARSLSPIPLADYVHLTHNFTREVIGGTAALGGAAAVESALASVPDFPFRPFFLSSFVSPPPSRPCARDVRRAQNTEEIIQQTICKYFQNGYTGSVIRIKPGNGKILHAVW